MNYEYKKVSFLHPVRMIQTANILYQCGKDMAKKYNIHHWDNSKIKTLAIVVLGLFGGQTYLAYDGVPIATFKIKKNDKELRFQKLATLPEYSGKGIGSWCMSKIEHIAKEMECVAVTMEVYDKSEHAKNFYLHKGYVLCGETKTRKYTEYKMKKELLSKTGKKKLLVIGAGFLQTFVIKKAKEMGYTVLAVDANPDAEGFLYADDHAVISIVDEKACLEYAKKENIDGILTAATDYGVLTASYIAQEMGLLGLKYSVAKIIKNKYETRKCLFENNVDDTQKAHEVNEKTDISELSEILSYPVMVKPCDGSGSRGASRVDKKEELFDACKVAMESSITGRATIEAFIDGKEYGAESLVVNGEPHILAIMQKWMTEPPYYAELGHAIPNDLPPEIEKKARDCVKKAIKALGINFGSVNMDMLITEKGDVHIIDIGARMGGNLIGSHIIQAGTGIDYMAAMISNAVGDCVSFDESEKSAVATRLLAFDSGVVKTMPDIKALEEKYDVLIEHHLKLGDIVNEYHTNLDGCGYIVATDNNVEDAIKKAENALSEIRNTIFN